MGNVIGKGVHTLYPQTQTLAMGHRLDESAPSKIAQRAERKVKEIMAFNFVKKVQSERGAGRTATTPTISIAENGQVRFNSLATKHIVNKKYLILDDMGDRDYRFIAVDGLPKGLTEADVVVLKWQDAKGNTLDSIYFGFGGTLKELGYDYKASGNQVFEATLQDVKEGKGVFAAVAFKLPKGKLTPKPVQHRERKNKANGVPTPPVPPSNPAEDEEALGSLMQ